MKWGTSLRSRTLEHRRRAVSKHLVRGRGRQIANLPVLRIRRLDP